MRRFLQVAQPLRDLGAHRFCRVCCSGSGEDEPSLLEIELLELSEVCELMGLDLLPVFEVALVALGELLSISKITVSGSSLFGSKSQVFGVR